MGGPPGRSLGEGERGLRAELRPGAEPCEWRVKKEKPGRQGADPVSPASSFTGPVRGGYWRPVWIAFASSPFEVSPLNSQKKAPRRPCCLVQLIFPAMVAGVS